MGTDLKLGSQDPTASAMYVINRPKKKSEF